MAQPRICRTCKWRRATYVTPVHECGACHAYRAKYGCRRPESAITAHGQRILEQRLAAAA